MLDVRVILHPTDFSEHSSYAFHLACSLARDYQARLVLLHVVEPPPVAYMDGLVLPIPRIDHGPTLEKLQVLKPSDPQIVVERRLVEGAPAEEILSVARDVGADLVVLGTHGRTGLGRLLMGSVAERVIHKATCPVLTVRSPYPHGESEALETEQSTAK